MGEFEIADAIETRGEATALKVEGRGEKDSQDGVAVQGGGHATASDGSFQAMVEGNAQSSGWERDALRVIVDEGALLKTETIPRAQPAGMRTLLGADDDPSPPAACSSSNCTRKQLALLSLKSQMATNTRPNTHEMCTSDDEKCKPCTWRCACCKNSRCRNESPMERAAVPSQRVTTPLITADMAAKITTLYSIQHATLSTGDLVGMGRCARCNGAVGAATGGGGQILQNAAAVVTLMSVLQRGNAMCVMMRAKAPPF